MGIDSDDSIWRKIRKLFSGNSADHIEQAIKEASEGGDLDAAEGSMLLSILELDDLQVQDIMTPRTDIIAIENKRSILEAIEIVSASGHSRLPIYTNNRDNIVGIVYAKDLLRMTLDPASLQECITKIMRAPFFVPETKKVLDLLNEFRGRKSHMAVILDEYGGTSGLVTIEDVLEEIVGDIEDEHDAPKEMEIEMLADGTILLAGRASLEDINEALNTHIESDEVDTIGGLLSFKAGRLPKIGEEFNIEDMLFIVKNADYKQVIKVLVKPRD